MKSLFKHIVNLIIAIVLFSCNDEFINEKVNITGVANSAIIISPEWEADDYQFECLEVGNADFVIESKPDWLESATMSGSFANGIATISAKANTYMRYAETGIYIEQMMIISGDNKYAVPVYYISEGDPEIETNQTFEIDYNNYNNQLQISNSGNGILLWDIVSIPEWLTINLDQFDVSSIMLGKNAVANLPLVLNMDKVQNNNLKGTIILVSNDENNSLVEISVSANLGTPDIGYFSEVIDFRTESTKNFRIPNYGDGILTWSFEQLPDWLTLSSLSGIIMPHTSFDIVMSVNSDDLTGGLHSANILLKTNDPEMPSTEILITVRIPGISENIIPLEGNIVDVKMKKSTNELHYITALPNKYIVYDLSNREIIKEIPLDKSPTCMAISEDFSKALIGHGGLMSVLNLDDNKVTKEIETDFMMFSAQWIKEDWYCYSKTDNSNNNLYWINTASSETYETETNHSFNTAYLTKVPNQPYVIGARKNISPTGIFIFNTDTKTMENYVHRSVGELYFFNNGELVVTQYAEIMRTSSLTSGSDPSSIGELKTEEYTNPIWWLDFSPVNNSIWALFSHYTHSYYPPEDATIYQFEDNDYSLVKKYTYDNQFQPDAETTPYEVKAHYVFSNNEGTELAVLRKGDNNNNWSIEFLPIIE